MKNIALIAFIGLTVVQWWIPGSMIWQKERVLRRGTIYKFETEPIDPSNPFKGKYISLRFTLNQVKTVQPELASRQPIYISLATDDSGFASIRSVTTREPHNSGDYIKATTDYVYDSVVYIRYPFQEFYMEESKAPKAERIYNEANRAGRTSNKNYAVVRVWKGDAVIENVYINGRPLIELIK